MLVHLENPLPEEVGESVEDFLSILGGPACVILDGEDSSRTRVYVTLLHGNEPSGVMALHRWLKQGLKPAVRIVCIIGSVKTALQPPFFHYRTLPGARDLNRCFKPPFNDASGRIAKAILDTIYQYQPEAVIDVHNTSGCSPAFGVATHKDHKHEALTTIFSDRLVITHLRLGALMDISEDFFPTVTIEVGGRLEQKAHDTAWRGLVYFFTEKDILKLHKPEWQIEVLLEPVRIHIKAGVSLTYADTQNAEFDVTLKQDLDQLNFTKVGSGTQLGWINRGGLDNFIVQDYKHRNAIEGWLKIEGDELHLAATSWIFLITTNPVIAIDDCLFYLVKPGKLG